VSLLILLVLSALAVAIQMIDSATSNKAGKPLKYTRRVIIVTDGRGQMDTSDLEQIAMKIKDADAPVEILLLGVDFDDPDYGFKEEDKDAHKVRSLFGYYSIH
jgi:ATP-dependent DNA helicase 2 subunit 2